MVLLYAFLFGLVSLSVDARSDYVTSIQPYTYTNWGSWGHIDWCSGGNYAYGFSLKVEGRQGSGDDTAVNGVKLLCRSACGTHAHSVTSKVMEWGSWTNSKFCPGSYFLKGVSVRSERSQGGGDDTAVNDYDFLCESSKNPTQTYPITGGGMSWGTWSGRKDCPAGSYICGIKTRVEGRQGGGDDTALNDAIFYCCTFPTTSCT